VGKPGERNLLPPNLQEREFPSPRKSLAELACEGAFPWVG
jgi:hypothetical protein